MTDIIVTKTNINITRLNYLIYAAATVGTKVAGYSLKPIQTASSLSKQTPWINNLQNKIEGKRKDLPFLNETS